jgi:hypothetical protein
VTARGPAVDCRPESGLTDTAPLRGTGVAGVVLRSDPATGPAPGAEVRVESSGVALVRLQTGADGRFAAYVPPSAYTIRVPNHPEGVARVTVTRGRLAHVSLAIEAGGR